MPRRPRPPYGVVRHAPPRHSAEIAVFLVGLVVHDEEFKLFVCKIKELLPTPVFEAFGSVLLDIAFAKARHHGALGTGVGHDAFEPVTIAHQRIPSEPTEFRGTRGFGSTDLLAVHPNRNTEILDD